jgi:hypothetical protein
MQNNEALKHQFVIIARKTFHPAGEFEENMGESKVKSP